MDKSWGGTSSASFRIRSNDSLADRAAERAKAREARAAERAGATEQRLASRAAAREADAAAREQARTQRREREREAAEADPHAAAARRHRSSGRKDVVREQRDTRGYATVVDEERIRALAKRGTSVAGLAAAFGISAAEVERALLDAD